MLNFYFGLCYFIECNKPAFLHSHTATHYVYSILIFFTVAFDSDVFAVDLILFFPFCWRILRPLSKLQIYFFSIIGALCCRVSVIRKYLFFQRQDQFHTTRQIRIFTWVWAWTVIGWMRLVLNELATRKYLWCLCCYRNCFWIQC